MTILCNTHWIGELMTTKQESVSLDKNEQHNKNQTLRPICIPVDLRARGSIGGG